MPSNPDLLIRYGRVLDQAQIAGDLELVRPALVVWTRLEPLPYSEDLTPALQAPVSDPLWMLARQWQFAEFDGEDAGTPIWSQLEGEIGRLARYLPVGAEQASDYHHLRSPLEVTVEREGIRARHPRLAAEAGEHFLRLLAAEGIVGARAEVRAAFPLEIADEALWAPDADPQGVAWQTLFAGRAVDGTTLAEALRDRSAGGVPTELPAALAALDNRAPALRAAQAWLAWYEAHVTEPEHPTSEAWVPERQEYTFQLATRFGDREVVLDADEYTDGTLDWYSFAVNTEPSLGASGDDGAPERHTPRPLLPSPVRYPGMPADRLWEFEDASVNLGVLEAGPTDLGRMLLAEYGLVFGNDWFLIPVELPVGSVYRVTALEVRDTFGVQTRVLPSRNLDGTRWTMFTLSGAEQLPSDLRDLYFLPPTLTFRLEGEPLEEVALLRDEMANLAWAVERRVQGASGAPLDRRMEPPPHGVHQRVEGGTVDAELIYRLMTPVADHWLPFVPVPVTGSAAFADFSIGLERRTLLRTLPDGTRAEVHPRGALMRSDPTRPVEDEPPLRLYEEEVPREGAQVTRSFQYTRWLDGARYLWVGRRKTAGRGEGSSGLRFDISNFNKQ